MDCGAKEMWSHDDPRICPIGRAAYADLGEYLFICRPCIERGQTVDAACEDAISALEYCLDRPLDVTERLEVASWVDGAVPK